MWTIPCVCVCVWCGYTAAVFSGVCVFACGCVCRFSCLYDKWQPDIGLRGRAAQMDYCLCPFFANITHNFTDETHSHTHTRTGTGRQHTAEHQAVALWHVFRKHKLTWKLIVSHYGCYSYNYWLFGDFFFSSFRTTPNTTPLFYFSFHPVSPHLSSWLRTFTGRVIFPLYIPLKSVCGVR